jgi:hypothetical protein
MKLSTFLGIKAVLCFVFGIPTLLAPAAAMSLYGITLDPAGAFMARYFGLALVGFGLACWFLRSAADSQTRRDILLALFITDTVGFVVAAAGQLAGLMNPLGWTSVAIWFLLAVGLGYFRFMQPGAS